MELWQLYLLEVAPNFATTVSVVGFVCAFLCALALFVLYVEKMGDETRPRLKKAIAVSLLAVLAGGLVPSGQGMYRIVGGYYVTNLENISELPKNALGAANAFLKRYAEDEAEQ